MSAASLNVAHRQFEAALPAMDRHPLPAPPLPPPPASEEASPRPAAYSPAALQWPSGARTDIAAVGLVAIAANYAARHERPVRRRRAGERPNSLDALDRGRCGGWGLGHPARGAGRRPAGDVGGLAGDQGRLRAFGRAAFRIDFGDWLAGLPPTKRRIAELLAEGHQGGVVARMLGLSPARITQVRSDLASGWAAFQGQGGAKPRPADPASEGAKKRRGRPRRAESDSVDVATTTTP